MSKRNGFPAVFLAIAMSLAGTLFADTVLKQQKLESGPFKGQAGLSFENGKVSIMVLPDAGGRIWQFKDLKTGLDVVNPFEEQNAHRHGLMERRRKFDTRKWKVSPLKGDVPGVEMTCDDGEIKMVKTIRLLPDSRTARIKVTYSNISDKTIPLRIWSQFQFMLERGDEHWADELGRWDGKDYKFLQTSGKDQYDKTGKPVIMMSRNGYGAFMWSPVTTEGFDFIYIRWKPAYYHFAVGTGDPFDLSPKGSRTIDYNYTYIPDAAAAGKLKGDDISLSDPDLAVLKKALEREFAFNAEHGSEYRERYPDLTKDRGLIPGEKPICRFGVVNVPAFAGKGYKTFTDRLQKFEAWFYNNMTVEAVNKMELDALVIFGPMCKAWSQTDIDYMHSQLKRFKMPVYVIPYSKEINGTPGKDKFFKELKGCNICGLNTADLKGVSLVFGNRIEGNGGAYKDELSTLLGKVKDSKAVLLFDVRLSEKNPDQEIIKLARDNNVAAIINGHYSRDRLQLFEDIPVWTVANKVWNHDENWLMGIVSVYPDRVEMGRMNVDAQPLQCLVVPNPGAEERMTPAEKDKYGLPSYSLDLKKKPTLTFAQVSDTQLGTSKKNDYLRCKLVAEELAEMKPNVVFMTGDEVSGNTQEEWDLFNEVFGKLDVPIYTVVGNHDMPQPDTDLTMFAKNTKQYASAGKDRFVLSTNACVFIGLNTWLAEIDKEQLGWVESELKKADKAKHVFIMGHYPILKYFGKEIQPEKGAEALLALMKKYKVAGYLFGHRHYYNYAMYDGTAHVLCDCLCWDGALRSYIIYHVFPDRIKACWRPVGLENKIPLYESVTFSEPRK